MAYTHAIVWLDHSEAHLIHLDEATFEKKIVRSPNGKEHLHHKRGTVGSGRPENHDAFFKLVVADLGNATEVLIVGPSGAKTELMKFAQHHVHGFENRVVGIETVDHPSDNQLVALARKRFVAADRMRGTQ